MSGYSEFANIYDRLMMDADYEGRSEYIKALFEKFGKKPSLLLDLACGTGKFSRIFAKDGIEVIGVDSSEEMLSVAKGTAEQEGFNILFLCQEADELDLYGTVDGAVCLMDSINHITDKKILQKAFDKVSLFLEKDCLFIFDVNTLYKHKEILGDNTFVFEEDGVFGVWQNSFDEESATTDIYLDFFEERDGLYKRYSDEFNERAYSEDELCEMLKKSGFEILEILGDLKLQKPEFQEERIFFIAKKI